MAKSQMYIVYSQKECEKKFLDEQFEQESGSFKVPPGNVRSLQDLIGKVSYEFYQHNESIFIQKLKAFLGQVLNMTFSLPLFRELLALSKKKDLAAEFYRSHFLAINSILCDGQEDSSIFNNQDCEKSSILIMDDLEQTVLSYKTLETFQMDNDMILTLQGLAESQQLDPPRHYFQLKDQKTTIFNSDRTTDETLEEYCQVIKNQRKYASVQSDKPVPPFMAPFKLERCFQSNILANCNKTPFANQNLQQSMQEYINSFKKQKGNGVAQMIINEQSLGKIARKQNKDKHERKKLQVELYQKTKSQKSNDYNRNIRTILMNKKLRDKKSKQKYQEKSRQPSPQINMKKKKSSAVQSAKQLKKPMHDVVECPEEVEYSFAKGMEPK